MEEKKSIFSCMRQWFTTFGVVVVIFILLSMIIGEKAQGHSTLFQLGKEGMTIATLAQLLILTLIITVGQIIFCSDMWIKNMSLMGRNILFFVSISLFVIGFAVAFGWFPIHSVAAWIGFIISFTISSTLSVLISRIRERSENDKMAKALEKFRE